MKIISFLVAFAVLCGFFSFAQSKVTYESVKDTIRSLYSVSKESVGIRKLSLDPRASILEAKVQAKAASQQTIPIANSKLREAHSQSSQPSAADIDIPEGENPDTWWWNRKPTIRPTAVPSYAPGTQPTSILVNVAGNGYQGFGGDGGYAVNAYLRVPSDCVVDSSGNLYVSDTYNNVIRFISAQTGIISTYAGTPPGTTPGNPWDDCAAPRSVLQLPIQIAIDTSANLYIADYGHNVVRLVTKSTGIISTYAGTMNRGWQSYCDGYYAKQAVLGQPYGVALDASNNLYISDLASNMIRVVNFQTKIISTFAGYGWWWYWGINAPFATVSLNGPAGMTVYNGNLFVADAYNNVIRAINIQTGYTVIVAGTLSRYGCDGDGYAATGSLLNTPSDVSMDGLGNIYISDMGNNRIRVVTVGTSGWAGMNGVINTFAGTGKQGYNGNGLLAINSWLNCPRGVFVWNSYSIYIADSFNSLIRLAVIATVPAPITYVPTRLPTAVPTAIPSSLTGRPTTSTPTSAPTCGDGIGTQLVNVVSVQSPYDVAISSTYQMYITTPCNVVQVSIATLIQSPFVGSATCGVTLSGTSALLTSTTPASFLVSRPTFIALDISNNVYFIDRDNNRLLSVRTSTSTLSTLVNVVGAPSASGVLKVSGNKGCSFGGIALDGSTVPTVYFSYNCPATVGGNSVFYFQPNVSPSLSTYVLSQGTIFNGLSLGTIPHNEGLFPNSVPFVEVFAGIIDGVAPLAPSNMGAYFMGNLPVNDVAITPSGTIFATSSFGTGYTGAVVYVIEYFANPNAVGNANYYEYVPAQDIYAGIPGSAGYTGNNVMANSSLLNAPQGLGLDPCNTLYIADQFNNLIRKVV